MATHKGDVIHYFSWILRKVELIAGTNVKKLEKAAASGVDELQEVADTLAAKMASPAKKAAILNAAAELKGKVLGSTVMEGDGGSGLGDTMASVNSGEVKLPSQEVPPPKLDFTQNPGKVMDDITFVRSHWWLVSEGFSLSTANSDVQKLPATLYHRIADSLAYAA